MRPPLKPAFAAQKLASQSECSSDTVYGSHGRDVLPATRICTSVNGSHGAPRVSNSVKSLGSGALAQHSCRSRSIIVSESEQEIAGSTPHVTAIHTVCASDGGETENPSTPHDCGRAFENQSMSMTP